MDSSARPLPPFRAASRGHTSASPPPPPQEHTRRSGGRSEHLVHDVDHAVAGLNVGGDHGGSAAEDTGRDEDGAGRAVDRDVLPVQRGLGGVRERQRVRRRDHGTEGVLQQEVGKVGLVLWQEQVGDSPGWKGSKGGVVGGKDGEGSGQSATSTVVDA